MQGQIGAAVDVKIQTLRKEEENMKAKAEELITEGDISAEALLERITEAERTVSKDSFDAISENKKKVSNKNTGSVRLV